MIAGDIRVNLLDIELLTIKLRLVIASLDTASQVGINWWQADPWLIGDAANAADGSCTPALEEENRQLRSRVKALEARSRDGGWGRFGVDVRGGQRRP